MNIWMVVSRFVMALMWWDASTATALLGKQKPPSAVEKAELWKPAKTKGRFSPLPTDPWKSRQPREIPTFPLRQPLLRVSSERTGRLAPPKTRNRTFYVLINPDILTYYRHRTIWRSRTRNSPEEYRAGANLVAPHPSCNRGGLVIAWKRRTMP